MASVRTLYAFKLRCFLGPLRSKPAYIAVLALVALLFAPGAFAAGYFFPDMPYSVGGLAELTSLGASLMFIFLLPTALSGGLLLHPAEIDFVATAPVAVRKFALADVLFQCTVYGTGFPFVILAAVGYGLRVQAPPWSLLVVVAAVGALGLLAVLVVQTLGIARSLRRRWAVPVIGAIAVAFLLPAVLRFGLHVPVTYASAPLPTSAAVQLALSAFALGTPWGSVALALFLVAGVVANLAITARGSVPNLRATFAFAALFEPGLGKQMQAEAMLRAFGRLRRTEGARLYRTSLVKTMTQLHLVRMTRDGTLFMVVLFSVVFGVVLFATPSGSVGGVYMAVILPVAAVGQWMQTDRPNLWVLAVSGQRARAFYQGWWIALAALTAVVGGVLVSVAAALTGAPDLVLPISVAGAALGGVALIVVAAARFPYVPSQFSWQILLHFLLAGVGAAMGTVPVLAAAWGASLVSPALAPIAALAVLVPIGVFRYGIVGAGAANPQL